MGTCSPGDDDDDDDDDDGEDEVGVRELVYLKSCTLYMLGILVKSDNVDPQVCWCHFYPSCTI